MRLASVSASALPPPANASCHVRFAFPFCGTEVVREEGVDVLDGGADVELDLAPKFLPFKVMSAAKSCEVGEGVSGILILGLRL